MGFFDDKNARSKIQGGLWDRVGEYNGGIEQEQSRGIDRSERTKTGVLKGDMNMSEKTYPPGQYIAGENLKFGDYLLKAEPDINGRVEMFEDYDHFISDDDFFYESFHGEYRLALRKQGVVVVVQRAMCTRIRTESDR